MTARLTISLDAMGGDEAPHSVLEGADFALARHPSAKFLLFGDEAQLQPLLQKHPKLAAASQIRHTAEAVSMEAKPSQVLRKGRETSMWLAVQAVKEGEAGAVVSAGNTGALMALSMFQLRTMEGIDRPALAANWPTIKGSSVVLDLGATIEATPKQLVDFAIMGTAFAQVVLHKSDPVVALLNIGSEDLKGHDEVRDAAAILKAPDLGLNFSGFVEGNDIGQGKADVVVTDGFTGNVALKTAEGTAKFLVEVMRGAFKQSWITKFGALIANSAFKVLKEKMDPRNVNGGVFLGLNGVVVKSHGGTDGMGFASALDLAIELADSDYAEKIANSLSHLENGRKEDQASGKGQGLNDGPVIKKKVAAQ